MSQEEKEYTEFDLLRELEIDAADYFNLPSYLPVPLKILLCMIEKIRRQRKCSARIVATRKIALKKEEDMH